MDDPFTRQLPLSPLFDQPSPVISVPSIHTFQLYVYGPGGHPLSVTLEQAATEMQAQRGLYFEWDGSFTWAGAAPRWQLSGTVYDNGNQVQYVDLHGRLEDEAARPVVRDHLRVLFGLWAGADFTGRTSVDSIGGSPERHRIGSLTEYQRAISLMRLPDQTWQELQDFETELLKSD